MAEAPIDGGSGGGTQFTSMSHEQMLEWLDQASSGEIQAAADNLTAAAKEIHKIAAELKVRPQWVTWKGEGADSFREWAGKLANATLGLGDFSEGSAKWMGEAANAISTAQASIPRDKKSAQANLDAATSAHNDPDARSVASKSSGELAAIAADKEKVRLEAAGHMDKLGQAFSLSSGQMDQLAQSKPKFPPPTPFVPEDIQRGGDSSYGDGSPGSGPSATARTSPDSVGPQAMPPRAPGVDATADGPVQRHDTINPNRPGPTVDEAPTHLGIDTVGTLPEATQSPAPTGGQTQNGPTGGGTGTAPPSTVGTVPPVFGTRTGTTQPGRATGAGPVARGTSPAGGTTGTARPGSPSAAGTTGRPSPVGARGPMTSGPNGGGAGRSVTGGSSGRAPTSGGVAGGRPQPNSGRPATGIPRGTVMGGEGATGGRGTTVGGSNPSGTGARGASTGRATGAPSGKGGVVGGRSTQSGRANARSFSPGGSGLVRGQGGAGSSSETSHGTGQAGRGGGAPVGSRPGKERDESGTERPDYVVEDEATWQPDDGRNVPSVVDNASENVDNASKNSER
ncbi:translation initiation factor IF-2 [Streptomyces sp. NPDC102467]|uniref:translation initiation factor IF-2 n=1 Tax=Streptomyces sp. NPDC102467 TaxID=3366179 RepID=UPI00381F959A